MYTNTHKTKSASFLLLFIAVSWMGASSAMAINEKDRPAYFLPEERKIILYYYRPSTPKKGLPPGLEKKDRLPPGLEKKWKKNGKLPPGLQRRLEPIPLYLDSRLPRLPVYWERVIIERISFLLIAGPKGFST
jgi:hypothetical protein